MHAVMQPPTEGRTFTPATFPIVDSRSVPAPDVGFGVAWTVRELDTRGVPGARGPRCLVFEHPELVRRLWTYPVTWTALSDAALLRLVDQPR
jgi:hypothetical protein